MSCKNYRTAISARGFRQRAASPRVAAFPTLGDAAPTERYVNAQRLAEKSAKRRRKEVYESFRTAIVNCGGSLTTFNKEILPVVKPQVLLIEMVAGFTPCGTSILLRKFGFPKICPIKYGIIENCPVQPS